MLTDAGSTSHQAFVTLNSIFWKELLTCAHTRGAVASASMYMSGHPGGIIIAGTTNMPRGVRVEIHSHLPMTFYL